MSGKEEEKSEQVVYREALLSAALITNKKQFERYLRILEENEITEDRFQLLTDATILNMMGIKIIADVGSITKAVQQWKYVKEFLAAANVPKERHANYTATLFRNGIKENELQAISDTKLLTSLGIDSEDAGAILSHALKAPKTTSQQIAVIENRLRRTFNQKLKERFEFHLADNGLDATKMDEKKLMLLFKLLSTELGTTTKLGVRTTSSYVFDGELAAAGRCHIYYAFNGTTIWCIKCCNPQDAQLEFEISQLCSNKHLIRYADRIFIDAEREGLVMPPFVRSVADMKNAYGNNVPEEAVKKIAICVLSALEALHKQHLAHCDVKPSNIMLHADGTAVLIDLGAVTKFGENIREYTPIYSIDADPISGSRFDLVCTASTMFELVNGNPPGEIKDIQRESGTHLGITIAKLCINSSTVSDVLTNLTKLENCPDNNN